MKLRTWLGYALTALALLVSLPAKAEVCFFERPNYQGASFCSGHGNRWVMWPWNDRIASVQVTGGDEVRLYEHWFFWGRNLLISSDTPDLGDRGFSAKASSFAVGTAASSTHSAIGLIIGAKANMANYLDVVLKMIFPTPVAQTIRSTGERAPMGPDFLWGVASSGFQSEGHFPDSNWTRYANNNLDFDPYGNSIDFFTHFEADLARAAALGIKTYRFSVEWSRIEPQPGVIDPAGLAFYDAVIQRVVALGLRPMLTLDHWVYPGWMHDLGGWNSTEMHAAWMVHARRVIDRYAPYDPMWITFNEPTFYLLREAENGTVKRENWRPMMTRLVAAHRAAYDYIHAHQANAMVSSNVAYIPGINDLVDEAFLRRVADKLDFIGVDYYYGLAPLNLTALAALTGGDMSQIKLQPEGIYYALRHYAEMYPKLPLFVIEAGMPTKNGQREDGQTRSGALNDSIYWLQRAKADGINIIGYNYWSLTDNYEWGHYAQRFGLYSVDVLRDPSLERKPTDGVAAYQSVIANQGVSASFKPAVKPAICSLVAPPGSCLRPVQIHR